MTPPSSLPVIGTKDDLFRFRLCGEVLPERNWKRRRATTGANPTGPCLFEYGRIEVTSTFHRNLREGLLTKSQYELVARQFESDDKDGIWTWLPLTADLCRRTAVRIYALPPLTFIRAGDALHLTSAAENGFAEIYSNDRRLQAAAALFGLRAVNVIPA